MMVKSTSAPQKMLMPQFQELVVSMSPKYIWKTVYLGGIPVLHSDPFYSPLSLLSYSQIFVLPERIRGTQET